MHAPGYALPKQTLIPFFVLILGLVFAVNSAASQQIRIAPRLFYSASSAGALRCSPNAFWFGSVLAGTTSTLSATLSNTGTTSITVYSVSQNLAEFSLTGLSLPMILAPKQAVDFQITFAPETGGHVDGSFSFSTNASSALLVFGVHGTGATKGLITASAASLSFGSIATGGTASLVEVLTNSGTSPLTISQISISGTGFSVSGVKLPLRLTVGQSVSLNLVFSAQLAGLAGGSLSISSNASNPSLIIPLSGSGAAPGLLGASSSSLGFGSVAVGSTQSLPVTLTNSGGSGISISQSNVSGAGFNVNGASLPLTLSPGQATTFQVGFNPQSGGAVNGSLGFTSNDANSPLTVALSGSAATAGVLSAGSASMSFGSVALGSSSAQSETVANSGGTAIAVSQVSVTGAGFSTSGLTLPLALAPGQNFTFGVAFAPASAGTASGAVTMISDASDPSLSIPVSGSAPAAALHGVSLTWTASTSQVAGYNVYRGTQSGGPFATINAAISASTAYNDTSVQSGQTYYYMITAVSSSGAESGYSNEIQTAIPGSGGLTGLLAAALPSLNFGSVQLGNLQSLPETISNTGGTAVIISQANVTGTGFSINGLTLPFTLTPGQSLNFNTVFTPAAAGSAIGSLSLVSNASDAALAVALTGSGSAAGQLAVSPSPLAFGNVVVGQNKTSAATLTASGSSVTISSATGYTSEFVLSGVAFPLTLAAGQSAALTVTFAPQSTGATSDSVSFLSSASNSPAIELLSGNGTATAVAHSVMLSWTGGPSGISGYNIYRTTASGGPYSKVNSTLNAATTYTDNSVLAGQTYYYVATAVNASGTESAYSSQIQTVIPTP